MDPASLLFLPRGEYAPLHLDPVLFESVGDGVAFESLTIPTQGSTLPPTPEPLKGLKSLADHFDSYEFTGRKRNVDGGPPKRRLGKAKAWESDLELELDQRIQHIERPNIFDSFIDMQSGIPNTRDDGSLSTFTSDASYEESANSSSSHEKERDSDAYARWNRQSIFGSLSHPAATDSLSWEQSRKVKETAEIALEIPALTKRPRDILDEYLNHDAPTNMSQKTRMARIDDSTNVRKIGAKFIKMGSQQYQADSWRALGKPEQQDVAIIGSVRSQALQGKSSKPQLTWESCSKTGPIEQPDMPFVSPYITEAGTALFEAVYQK
ncbi:hypothetical protein BGX28_002418 [Mortierella sp. GBA30]|nr:hypothetical protein BGX28_002418 [Mortierella sp. GBA30]